MKKVKVIFPDGSIAELDESQVSGAISAGAKRYTDNSVDAKQKSTSMVFPDGSIAEIPDNSIDGALKAGAIKKKDGSNGAAVELNGTPAQSVPTTSQSFVSSHSDAFALPKYPQVNVAGANVFIDAPIQQVLPIPQMANKQELAQQLQNRINTKTYTQDDIGVVAQSMGISAPAANAYMQGKIGTGTVIHFNDVKAKKGGILKATFDKSQKELGLGDSYENVFSSPELAGAYLQKIEGLYQSKANQQSVSSVQEGIKNNPLAYNEGFGAGVVNDTPSKETLNSAQQIKGIISNDIIDKISDDNSLTVDEKVRKIYGLTDPRDKANVKKAIDKRLSPTQYLIDVAIGGNTSADIDLLNSQKAGIEYQVNRSLNNKLNYNLSLKKSIAEDYASKVESREVSVEDKNATDHYTNQINAVDQQIQQISTQVVPTEKLYQKYPVLFKSAIAQAVNEFNAIQSGNVKGYENGGDVVTSLAEYLTERGFDIKDQKVQDFVRGDNFKDYSFFGRPLQNIVDVFKNTGKAILDLTPLRDEATILAEKKQAGLFPTQISPTDELQLTQAAKIGQNIGNTTGQVIGQALLQVGTAGIGRMAGLSKVAAANAGFWGSGALTSYDQAYKDSYDFIDNSVGRTAYAGLIALSNAASEKIFPEAKIFQIPGVSEAIGKLAQKAGARELTNELSDELLGKAKNAFVDYAKKYAKNVGQETIEETATDLFESGTRFIFGDKAVNADTAIESAVNTAIQTAIGTSLIGGLGAHRDVQSEKNVSAKSTIYNAAIYPDKAMDAINIGYEAGLYDTYERDAKIAVLNTAQQSVGVMTKTEKVAGKTLTRPERELYVANLTAESILTAQKKDMDVVGQAAIDEKLTNLQNQRQQILNGEVIIDEDGNVSIPIKKENVVTAVEPTTNVPSVAVADNEILPTLEKVKAVVPEGNLVAAQNILTRVNNAENININEIESAQNELYSALDAAPEAAHLIEPLILKLQDYEFTTKTENSTVTQKEPTGTTTKVKKAIQPALEQSAGSEATITKSDGTTANGILNITNGNYVLNVEGQQPIVIGEKAITDRDLKLPSEERVPEPIQFDENSNVKSVTFETKNGDLVTINNPEKALDIAIQLQADAIGEIPDAAFEPIYKEVQSEISKEVPLNNTNEGATGTTNEPIPTKTKQSEGQGNTGEIPTVIEPTNVTAATATTPTSTGTGPKVNNGGNGGKPPIDTNGPTTNTNDENNELNDLANNIPNLGQIKEYASKGTIEKYHGETPANDQSIIVQELRPALEHGEKIIDTARSLFGDKDYVEKTLGFIDQSKVSTQAKALMYISLENALAREKDAHPNNLDIQKKQDLVRSKSQAFLREASLAINFGKLRKIGEVGYDISKITDNFFSAKEKEQKDTVEKSIEANSDEINKEAENKESADADLQQKIDEAVESEINKIHEKLPSKRKQNADKAIKALENFQKKIRSKSYDATLGIPAAIIDSGITIIKHAIKAGVHIADAIDLGVQHIKEKYGKAWDKEGEFRGDMVEGFRAEGIKKEANATPSRVVKDALIESGFGREVNVTRIEKDADGKPIKKDGKTVKIKEKKNIIDWKKLAGEEGSIDKMKENVQSVLEKQGYTKDEISDIQNDLADEYTDLRASVIEHSINELNKRNEKHITPEQKSAARKLAELYNYGLFEQEPANYDVLLGKAIGMDKLSPERFQKAHELGKALQTIFSTKFNGRPLNDLELKTALQAIDEKMRILLHDEAQGHGSAALKLADIVRTYMDATQRMILNSLKQATENPLSGGEQNAISNIDRLFDNSSTPELKAQKIKIAKAVYKDMVLHGGVNYGDVGTTFVSRGNLDAYINKMSDNKVVHGIASTIIGKTTLDAVDAFYKSKLTDLKFTHNLIKVLTEKRLVNGKVVEGMPKEEAVKYVSETLTGQSYADAQKTAKEIIDKVNSGGKKIIPDNTEFVNRLANDIVKAALINGKAITTEQVTAAYNAAYRSAGRNLGHVPNNPISEAVQGVSGKIEKKINDAIKNKEYKKAALLTYQSIFFRNVLNPFVGGGTNWVVLKLEKNGLGLISGLYNGGKTKLDLSSEAGLKDAEKALYEEARDRDALMRGAIGGATALLTSMLWFGVANTDDYRKWRNKNKWAARYLDLITPESALATMAAKNKQLGNYVGMLVNKNDIYDKGSTLIKSIDNTVKGKTETGAGQVGQAVGSSFGVPVPWRLVRDFQNIWLGAKGEEPYKVSSKPAKGFWEGAMKAGLVDYIKNNPLNK